MGFSFFFWGGGTKRLMFEMLLCTFRSLTAAHIHFSPTSSKMAFAAFVHFTLFYCKITIHFGILCYRCCLQILQINYSHTYL